MEVTDREFVDPKDFLFTPEALKEFYEQNGRVATERKLLPFASINVNDPKEFELIKALLTPFVHDRHLSEFIPVEYHVKLKTEEERQANFKLISIFQRTTKDIHDDIWRLLKPEVYIELWKFVNEFVGGEETHKWVNVATEILFGIWSYIAARTPMRTSEYLTARYIIIVQFTPKRVIDEQVFFTICERISLDEGRDYRYFDPMNTTWTFLNVTPKPFYITTLFPERLSLFENIIFRCSNNDCRAVLSRYLDEKLSEPIPIHQTSSTPTSSSPTPTSSSPTSTPVPSLTTVHHQPLQACYYPCITATTNGIPCPRCRTTYFCNPKCWIQGMPMHFKNPMCSSYCGSCGDLLEYLSRPPGQGVPTRIASKPFVTCGCGLVNFCNSACQSHDLDGHRSRCVEFQAYWFLANNSK